MVEHPAVNGRVAGSSPAPGGGHLRTKLNGGYMRKVIALGVLASMLPTLAIARGNHPMAGCGLGYLLLSNEGNDKVKQVLGSTTNGTFGSQTFGISSGTSGCTEDGAVKLARATEVFAEVNLSSLRQDIAAGHGEY